MKSILAITGFLFLLNNIYAVEIDLISPTNCETKNDHLMNCKFEPKEMEGSGLRTQFVPLRTRVKVIKEGNCETQYPVQIKILAKRDDSEIKISAVAEGEDFLVTSDKGPAGVLMVTNANKWFSLAAFDESCRTKMTITLDEPKINHVEEAQTIVKKLDEEMQSAAHNRDAYQELMDYRTAFRLMSALAANFFIQLNETFTNGLKPDADQTRVLLDRILGSRLLNLNSAEKETLARLGDFLAGLDSPAKWKGKKLSDFFNEQDQKVIEKLAARMSSTDEDSKNFQKYAQRFLELQQEVRTAYTLLKPWLRDDDWRGFASATQPSTQPTTQR